jgi:hypothetical protein
LSTQKKSEMTDGRQSERSLRILWRERRLSLFLLTDDRHYFLPHSGMIKEAMADLVPFEDKTFLFLFVLFSLIIGYQPPLLLFLSSRTALFRRIWCPIE